MIMTLLLGLCGCGGGGSPPATASAGSPGGPPPPPESAPPPAESTPPPAETPPSDAVGATNESPQPSSGSPDSGLAGGLGYQPSDQQPGAGPEGFTDAPAIQAPRIKSWREQAEEALLAGNEQEWFRLIHTNFVINPRSWKELDKYMAWVPGLRRPALGTRFGIAAVYINPPRDFEGSPQPIGSAELKAAMASLQQNAGNSGGESRRPRRGKGAEELAVGGQPGGGELPSSGDGAGREQSELVYHTGEFGSKFVDALKGRIESGAYGSIFREMAETVSRGARREGNPNDPNSEGEGTPGLRLASPDASDVGRPGDAAQKPSTGAGTRLAPAIVWLGKAKSKEELAQLAEQANVDVLVTYEIALRTAKQSELVNNTTKMKIAMAKREEPIFASAPLENRIVLLAREKAGRSEDPVDKEVSHAMEALDKAFKAVALPAGVTSEAVKRRIGALIAEKPSDPLPAVVEARYYAAKGLLTESEATRAAMALLGEAEYAQLIASAPYSPGSEEGVGQMVGRALSVAGVLDMLSVANAVTGQTVRDEARTRAAAEKTQTAPASGGGLKGLLPFGFGPAKQ
jgi:hypothetical protein